jgi:acyl-CoA thioesterase-1
MRTLVALFVLAIGACSGDETPEDTGRTAAVGSAALPANSGAGTVTTDPRPATTDTRPTILIIGTSLTAGYGLDDPDDAYPAVMQRIADSAGFNVRIANAGLSGETSAGALRRLDWVLREPAAFVIIETGANDGLRGLDVDTTRANLRAIVRRVKSQNPRAGVGLVQMEAPPNLGQTYTQRFRESFGLVAREEGAVLFPFLLDSVAGVARLNQGDGIHPNVAGARRVGAIVWRSLEPELRALGAAPR